MRVIAYSLILIVCISFVGSSIYVTYVQPAKSASEGSIDGYRKINTYALNKDKVIRIEYPKSSIGAKFLFHTILSDDDGLTTSDPTEFSVRISVTGEADDSRDTVHTFSVNVGNYIHNETNSPLAAYVVSGTDLSVSDSDNYEISLLGLKKKSLQLTLVTHSPNIKKVIMRPFHRVGSSVKNAKIKWARLSRHEQNRLARFHPLGRDFLTDDEISNVLKNRNLSIAPAGIEGVDFDIQALHIYDKPDQLISIRDDADTVQQETLNPESLRSIRVFEPTVLKISASQIDKGNDIKTLGLKYERASKDEAAKEGIKHSLSLNNGIAELSLQAGDYVFSSETPVYFSIEENLFADVRGRRSYFHQILDNALHFTIHPNAHKKQFLKVELLNKPESESEVRYFFEDALKKVINTNTITHRKSFDPFLHSGQPLQLPNLSEISSSIIIVPDQATKVTFSSDQVSFVRVSNSLDGLASKMTINGPQTKLTSNWFDLKPQPTTNDQNKRLLVTNYGRYKNSTDKSAIAISTLHPTSRLSLHTIYEINSELSDESVGALLFSQVEPNKTLDWKISNSFDTNDSTIKPRIVYLKPNQQASDLQVYIDGKRYNYDLPYRNGELQLPNIEVGEHTLKLRSATPLKVFINHTQPLTNAIKKREMYLVKNSAFFTTEKPIKEDQLIQLIIAQKEPLATAQFDIEITSNESDIALLNRRYSFANESGGSKGLNLASSDDAIGFLPTIYLKPESGFNVDGNTIEIRFADDKPRFVAFRVIDQSEQQNGRAYLDRLAP